LYARIIIIGEEKSAEVGKINRTILSILRTFPVPTVFIPKNLFSERQEIGTAVSYFLAASRLATHVSSHIFTAGWVTLSSYSDKNFVLDKSKSDQ
jgi:hypothetical protein